MKKTSPTTAVGNTTINLFTRPKNWTQFNYITIFEVYIITYNYIGVIIVKVLS